MLLERIVGNLLANALAHTPEEAPVEITFATARARQRSAWSTTDQEWTPSHPTSGRNRNGLGLLIVDKLAGFLGAEVAYRETAGGGLTASVGLPT